MDETWVGGFYEVAIVLGKTQSATADARLRRALTELWSIQDVRLSQELNLDNLNELGRIEGTLDHPTLGALVFGTVVVREREAPNGDDWLYAVVPLGGLSERVESVGAWPAGNDEGSRSWREPLEETLGDLALAVARAVPITMALIGYEIAGVIPDFNPDGPRRIGFVLRGKDGELAYWPTTDW